MTSARQRADHRAFVESFRTPATTTTAWKFGRQSAFHGHPRLSFAEFFAHDAHPRPYGRTGLYRAYRHGYDRGRADRRAHAAKLSEREAVTS